MAVLFLQLVTQVIIISASNGLWFCRLSPLKTMFPHHNGSLSYVNRSIDHIRQTGTSDTTLPGRPVHTHHKTIVWRTACGLFQLIIECLHSIKDSVERKPLLESTSAEPEEGLRGYGNRGRGSGRSATDEERHQFGCRHNNACAVLHD